MAGIAIPDRPWTNRHRPPSSGAGQPVFGLVSLGLHAAILVALTVFVRSVPPEPSDDTPVEMVFAPPAAELVPPEPPPPEQAAEAAPEAQPLAPEPLPSPQPDSVPAPAEARPPPPKPKPVRTVRPAVAPRPVAAVEASTAPPLVPTAPAPAEVPVVDSAWQAAVAAWLASHKSYPEDARRRGEEGRVAVRFTVDRSGRVLEADIAASSGVQRLDDAAAALMRNAALPRFPASMTRDRVTIVTTVRYGLR
jgi:protein TonB